MSKFITITFLIILILFSWCVWQFANASEIDEATAIKCIVGEAADQGERGMLVLAEALRNRGTTKGVYGCSALHIVRQPKWVFEKALHAWRESASTSITKGATNWENIKAFGKPSWAYKMIETYRHKDHVFYREP